jgi:hypothetical protein
MPNTKIQLKLIVSEFRVPGLKVTTDGYGRPYCPRSGIPDIPHWVNRLYKHLKSELFRYKQFKAFSSQNVEP